MEIADTDKIFNRVAEGKLDVGVVEAWANNRKVDGFAWLEDELVVIMPRTEVVLAAVKGSAALPA